MIYNEGKARERRAVQPQYPKRSGSSSSLLDDICGFADEDDTVLEDAAVGELESFFRAYRTYGRGERDAPLAWWKVNSFIVS